MLVAIVADTHLPRGSRAIPEECLRRLRTADLILHAGDVVSAAALEQLRTLGPRVQAVHGNMDEPALKEALPKELVVEVGEARVGMIHIPGPAAGREARLAARFPGCDAVVYGHTHVPQVARVEGVWILNPGSPTERRRAPAHTMIELRVHGRELEPELVVLDA
ncbi:MAG TPA: metallophosphoesterase family protein [Gaiellaceae bacterium]|nr:metallophosphoesterase family protein [Gaiellaceae bacterium]